MRSYLEKYISLCIYALKKPCCCASKPHVRRASKPEGINFETKIIIMFWWFFSPADQNDRYHTPLLYKIWGSQNEVLNMEERGEQSQADNSQWRLQQKEWRQYRATPALAAQNLCLNQISQSSVNKNAIAFIECPCLTLNVKCLLLVCLWDINCFVFTKNLEQQ